MDKKNVQFTLNFPDSNYTFPLAANNLTNPHLRVTRENWRNWRRGFDDVWDPLR